MVNLLKLHLNDHKDVYDPMQMRVWRRMQPGMDRAIRVSWRWGFFWGCITAGLVLRIWR